ncbi:MAG: hypothetical protein LBJ57_06870 [Prevotellaceae bacterium]|jgi:hypothetical protein|nr:hypothetical protein [Prevotellaceae bacterium]
MLNIAFVKHRWRWTLIVLVALAVRCQQQEFTSDASATLYFSSDTLNFDTIFATLGSTTFSCRVYNTSDKNLLFDEVLLRKGEASPFRMNVDGRAGYSVGNVKLARRDSLFIFIEVKKNKNLLLSDAIVFMVNGQELSSKLEVVAYGQDAVVLDRDTALPNGYTFTADKPYILGGVVAVDSGATVAVEAGAKLYFGGKAGIAVSGTLRVEGVPENPCIFSFPRYNDPWYKGASGQWVGISIGASGRASVSGARISGARCAFAVTDTLGVAGSAQLTLKNSVVEDAEVGVRSSNGKVDANNCLFANHLSNAALIEGGSCTFYSCTFAADAYRGTLVVLQSYRLREKAKNRYDTIPTPLNAAHFANSIIYGKNINELSVRELSGQPAAMRLTMERCMVKLSSSFDLSNGERYVNVTVQDPAFRNVSENDFHLSEGSPAINAGEESIARMYPIDADGYDRNISNDKSLGCYAYRP